MDSSVLESAAREWQKDKVRLETANVQLERVRLELESERIQLNEIINQQKARIAQLEKELHEVTTAAGVPAASGVNTSAGTSLGLSAAAVSVAQIDALSSGSSQDGETSPSAAGDDAASLKVPKSRDKRKSSKTSKTKSKEKAPDGTKKKRKGSFGKAVWFGSGCLPRPSSYQTRDTAHGN